MKAIITDKLTIPVKNWTDIEILSSLGVTYNTWKDCFIIYPQKITLDEKDMNELYSEVLQYDTFIEYVWLGGAGCDFSIYIRSNDARI